MTIVLSALMLAELVAIVWLALRIRILRRELVSERSRNAVAVQLRAAVMPAPGPAPDSSAALKNELDDSFAALSDLERRLAEMTRDRDAVRARLAEATEGLPDGRSRSVPHELPLGRDIVADSVVDGADLGALVVRAASARGDYHREQKQHRREAVSLRLTEAFGAPILLSTLATGAPRAQWSRSAASRACESLAYQIDSMASVVTMDALFSAQTSEPLDGLLRIAAKAVGASVRMVAVGEGLTLPGGETDDQAVRTSVLALLTQVGDRGTRRHLAVGVGDDAVLRLRSGVWEKVFGGTGDGWLPKSPESIVWGTLETEPGDLLAVCSASMAAVLQHPDLAGWFAKRWSRTKPDLTRFLTDVSVSGRNADADRSVVCLWDFGDARSAAAARRVQG